MTTLPTYIENVKNGDFGRFSLLYGIVYAITTVLTVLLSGISVASALWLYQQTKERKKFLGANIGGLAAASLSVGCPVCGAYLLSAIGIAGGLSIFPLQGLELKLLSLGLFAGSLIYSAKKVEEGGHCLIIPKAKKQKRLIVVNLKEVLVYTLAGLFIINQSLMTKIATDWNMTASGGLMSLLKIRGGSSYTIIAPKLNPDGKTTSIVEWPTISEVKANPNSGDALADAKIVMIATGKPFYAPGDVSFDDPINAQKKWGAYETSIKLSPEQETRYQKLITTMMTCSYCCGSPGRVTMVKNCGCAHAKAARGFYKYMIQNSGDKYTDEQLVGESHRWYALWYPKGMLEDYLLATGNEAALPHTSHGGAGADGRHGLAK